MAFNIYEWRRNQLLTESSVHPDPKDLTTNPEADLKQYREQLFQRLLKDFENDPEAIAIIKKQMGDINETKVSGITFSKDVLYPTSISMGSSKKIESESEFEKWKKKFIDQYGDIELEKGAAGWKASSKHEANKQAQADADKYAKRK
jgi:hypothetical protein